MTQNGITSTDHDTIEDFGNQWTKFDRLTENICSREQLADHCGPLFDIAELKNTRVLDIGSGSGCVVQMLLDAGAGHVTAIEPSKAMDVCRRNTAHAADRIRYVQVPGDQAPTDEVDAAISLGVLHHIVDPEPVVRRVREALKPGGAFVVWIYGREGNELYLALFEPIRKLTKVMPDFVLAAFCRLLAAGLSVYTFLCRFLPLPMRSYMRNVIARQSWNERVVTIFDQLNPAYAKYYRKQEAYDLLAQNGFEDVKLYHRHAYSWTVVGRAA